MKLPQISGENTKLYSQLRKQFGSSSSFLKNYLFLSKLYSQHGAWLMIEKQDSHTPLTEPDKHPKLGRSLESQTYHLIQQSHS